MAFFPFTNPVLQLKSQLAEEPLVLARLILLLEDLLHGLASLSALGSVGNDLRCDSHGLEVDVHRVTAHTRTVSTCYQDCVSSLLVANVDTRGSKKRKEQRCGDL